MDQNKYVLVKMITGETLIGSLLEQKANSITLEKPLSYQLMTITTPAGTKIKEILVFRNWCDFALDTIITFNKKNILSILTPDSKLSFLYSNEIANIDRKKIEKVKQEQSDEENKEISEDSAKAISGNLNFNFAFDDPDQFQMFMDGIQMSIDNLMEEMNGEDMEELSEEDMEQILEQMPPQNRKKAKKRNKSKESFDLPYDKDADPKDPRSWSNNPNDYL